MGRGTGRRSRRRWLLAAAVAIAATAALPGNAAAAPAPVKPGAKPKKPKRPSSEFFAVQTVAGPTPGEMDAVSAAKVGTLRVPFLWSAVERSPGMRRWLGLDYAVGLAAYEGVRVLPILYGTPRHFGPALSHPPIHAPEARAAWALFAADAVRRYGPGGSFWRQYPSLPYLPVTEWQVWNEPNGTVFWHGQPNVRDYADLVRITADAVRAVDHGARIVLAGMLLKPREPLAIGLRRFLRRLYRIRGMRRAFDSVAVHPYARRPKRVLHAVRVARRVMDKRGDRRARIWVTEIGWATGGTGDFAIVTTPEDQARRLTGSYRRLLRQRRALKLEGIVWLMLRDHAPPGHSIQSWIYHLGLFAANGAPKPAWPALTRFTGGTPAPIVEPAAGPPAPVPPRPPPPPPPPPNEPCFLLIFC